MPMTLFAIITAVIALLVLNLPVAVLLGRLPFIADLAQVLKEKSPIGGADDTTSYSRVTGLVGAVIMTSFFWAMANIIIFKAFTAIGDIRPLISSVQIFFLVGAAMFLPYAFNQIRSAFAAGPTAAAAATAAANPPKATASNGSSLSVTVANLSTAIDDAAMSAAVAAIALQVSRDFQPEWGAGAKLSAVRITLNDGAANIDAASDAVIYVGDASDDPTLGMDGVFGYHSQNNGQLPYAFIYLDVCAKYGEAWSCTLSHEVLEMLADPTLVIKATGPAPVSAGAQGQTVSYDLEVCDPTQGDTYQVNNITVSNFVTKAWFGMPGGSAATNFLNLPLSPFTARPKGYFQYEDATGAHTVNGTAVDAQRLAARAILARHRRTGRRQAMLSPKP
jgi:hypothetical protein